MNIPVLVLLGFAGWTLLTLIGSVGIYRWSRILTGRASLVEWQADLPQGSDWYRRAMRAHMNCVENLPVFGALFVALLATGLQTPSVDTLSVAVLLARMGQTLVHIAAPPSNFVAATRFALYLIQAVCMIVIGILILLSMHCLQGQHGIGCQGQPVMTQIDRYRLCSGSDGMTPLDTDVRVGSCSFLDRATSLGGIP